jgi:predicted negative regulator of RcsB-dependent stress response
MAYDLEEQERIDEIRHWWKQNRVWLLSVLALSIAAVVGWLSYKDFKARTADKAATAYEEVAKAGTDVKKVSELATKLAADYPKTFDATRAGLQAAKVAFDANDLDTARKHLEWVAASGVNQHRALASVRLAMVLLDQKKYDEALKALDAVKDPGFIEQVADTRGDVLVAAGRLDEARVAYKAAIDAAKDRSPFKQASQAKFDAIGGVAAPTVAPVATGITATGNAAPTAAAPAAAPAAPATAAPAPVVAGAPVVIEQAVKAGEQAKPIAIPVTVAPAAPASAPAADPAKTP